MSGINTPQPTNVTQLPTVTDFMAEVNTRFADNTFGLTQEVDFRDVFALAAQVFTNWRELNVRRVLGATYPVPFIDSLGMIPLASRILGMQAEAVNGVDSSTGGAGVTAPPVFFQLIRDSSGDVDALLDAEPTTTLSVKARWVRVSGTDAERAASFPAWVEEDHPYDAGDVFQYTFNDLTPPVTRLFEVRNDQNFSQNPAPTGRDDDAYYKPYAPLTTAEHAQNTDRGTTNGQFSIRLDSQLQDQGEQRTLLVFEGMQGSAKAAISFKAQEADNSENPVLEQCLGYTGTSADVWTILGGSIAASNAVALMNGVAGPGTSTDFSRADHVHPSDTSKVDKETGKSLSTNDFTTAIKNRLANTSGPNTGDQDISGIAANTAAIAAETAARQSADAGLQTQATANAANISANTAAISAEVTARAAADTALQTQATTNASNIAANAAAISLKAPLASPAFTGTVTAATITATGAVNGSNLSGTNTGDETGASIKTKLGVTTLSGINTGDQDLSGLATNSALTAHTGNTANPHSTTKAQVGLGNVPNTDATQRVNHTGTQAASTIVEDATHRFATDAEKATWNAKQAALGYTPENSTNKSTANGYASLDGTGKVPAAQLPATATPAAHASTHISTGSDPIPPAVASGASGLLSGADKAKLDGVATGAQTGTVTSVGLAVSGVLHSVSNSPVTGSGTLTLGLLTQAANAVLAGPTSGGAATPTMRALVAADMPATVQLKETFDLSAYTVSATFTADFSSSATTREITVTSSSATTLTLVTANRAQGKVQTLDITNAGTGTVTLVLEAWKTFGSVPTTIAPGKTLIITLSCQSATATAAAVRAGFVTSN